MRRRTTLLATTFLLLVGVALGVGAWQLARAQSGDRADLREAYAGRATVASSLVDALFRVAFQQTIPRNSERFGGRVDPEALDAQAAQSQALYLAVLRLDGRPIGVSGATPGPVRRGAAGRERFVREAATAKILYALSDITTGPKGVPAIGSAIRFPGRGGERLLLTVSPLETFRSFLAGSLKPLTPVGGGDAYVLDGANEVIAAVSAGRPRKPDPELIAESARHREGTYRHAAGERYFASSPLPGSHWRIVLSAPTKELYAPVSGTSRWLPWVVFALCALSLLAIAELMRRSMLARERLDATNRELGQSEAHLRQQAGELQRSNTDLQRSNADLEQFAYVASHDLSAPLRAVAGFSQLLSARYKGKLDSSADEFIHHMQEGVDRMQRIIDDLLAYSRVERTGLTTESVDLERVLADVLHALDPELRERGAIVTHDPLPTVRGERGQLGQVLQNLIANGVKFTAPGAPPRVHVGAERQGSRWRIEVRDNGIGIAPEHADRIFKMFQRLHGPEEYAGTGIGLAIVKKIVDRHGGELSVRAAEGGGSVFSFTLAEPVGA